MAIAIRAGYQLPLIAACLLLLGVYLAAEYVTRKIRDLLDFGIDLGVRTIHPLRFLSRAVDRLLVQGAEAGVIAMSEALESLLAGLADSLAVLIAAPIVLGLAVKEALAYLWTRLLVPKIRSITDVIAATASRALARVRALEQTVVSEIGRVEDYAAGQATRALRLANTYADEAARLARTDAIRYADQAVSKVRKAEAAAVGAIEGELVDVAGQLERLRAKLGTAELAALIAAIPVLGALVNTIATEAGLENAECRAKVRNICQTNPGQWGALLGGLTLMVGVLNLREVAELVRPLVRPAGEFMRQVA